MTDVAPAAAFTQPRERFPTFANLVKDENDLVGLIAYSLYKQDKLAFIQEGINKAGVTPSEADLAVFCRGANIAGRLASYRQSAEILLQQMNGELLDMAVIDIESDFEQRLIEAIHKLPESSWPKHLFQHVVGSLLATALAVMLVLTVLGYQKGFLKLGQDLLNVEITPREKR